MSIIFFHKNSDLFLECLYIDGPKFRLLYHTKKSRKVCILFSVQAVFTTAYSSSVILTCFRRRWFIQSNSSTHSYGRNYFKNWIAKYLKVSILWESWSNIVCCIQKIQVFNLYTHYRSVFFKSKFNTCIYSYIPKQWPFNDIHITSTWGKAGSQFPPEVFQNSSKDIATAFPGAINSFSRKSCITVLIFNQSVVLYRLMNLVQYTIPLFCFQFCSFVSNFLQIWAELSNMHGRCHVHFSNKTLRFHAVWNVRTNLNAH